MENTRGMLQNMKTTTIIQSIETSTGYRLIPKLGGERPLTQTIMAKLAKASN